MWLRCCVTLGTDLPTLYGPEDTQEGAAGSRTPLALQLGTKGWNCLGEAGPSLPGTLDSCLSSGGYCGVLGNPTWLESTPDGPL